MGLSEDPVVEGEDTEDVIVIMEVVAELDDQFGWTSKFMVYLW